jgi:hypothetical protein
VHPAETALIFPVAKTGNRRKRHIPDRTPVCGEAMLAEQKWPQAPKSARLASGAEGLCRFAVNCKNALVWSELGI